MKMPWMRTPTPPVAAPKYPGTLEAMDGSAAVVAMETAASEGAGAYPITPSTQMGEGWAVAVAEGRRNVNGRRLLFFEPEGEHAAAAVTAGMSMTGLRATNFSSGQGIAYMHESLYAAVGKRLTYVLNVACRAMTKHALNVHAGHDDYHAVDDTGFFQLFARDVQGAADLNLIAHRIAELSLNPGICAQDGFLTSHVIETMRLPEHALVREYLGDPSDLIDSPTPAQRLVFGAQRRRIPEMFDLDYPAMLGVVQNQDSYAQGVAAQRPFYFDHIAELADRAFAEYAALTGRRYARATGYRLDDAEYAIVGQGSVVSNAEAVCDHLRATRGLPVGVLDLTMFRPFPADLVARLLADKRGVVVLERTDQPLAVDAPLLREIRAAMAKAAENGRVREGDPLPHPALPVLPGAAIPDFYSGCFGLGSRDLQPGDIVAAVENMLPGGRGRRQFYLGVEFVRPGTRLPKLQVWQETLADGYPHLGEMSLPRAGELNLLPPGSIAIRIHSVGGWGAITMGKNLAQTAFELFGLQIKANPKYGSEKKGQPTTFYAVLAREPVRLNCELHHVDVVLSPDPNVFRHSNPLAGLADGGVFVIQSDGGAAGVWDRLPGWAKRELRARDIKVYALDAFAIAAGEASDAELRYRMQGAAFMGAFFAVSPILAREHMERAALFAGVRKQLEKKFGHRGQRIVDDNLRVIERGFDEVRPVAFGDGGATADEGALPELPAMLDVPARPGGVGNPGRFWEQVCALCTLGQDGIADPFAAISAIPAVTGVVRDMSGVRLEVPSFIAARCTGCSQCWTQCPDSAIPGLVSDPDQLIAAAMSVAGGGRPMERMRQVAKPLGKEVRRLLQAGAFTTFADALSAAQRTVAGKLGWDADRRAALDAEFASVLSAIASFPLAKTRPYFDLPEGREKGSGGLLSITINPEACKGCRLCVDVCPDGALEMVRQDDDVLATLRRNWTLWNALPDTDDRFINIADLEEGIGVLPSMLLKKRTYRSMVGGDGACMGCGEKSAVHLVVSAIHALMAPRVARHVARLDDLIARLDARARELLTAGADVELAAGAAARGSVTVAVDEPRRGILERIGHTLHELKDLRWRYVEGPGGRGRAPLGMANSTGCSSVWGSTYPYNPYPFPWVNHLFQDSPSVAIGIFEGHMRKMADGFVALRRAELLVAGEYDAERHEKELAELDWTRFTDDEFDLCPPIVSMGGDGAMLDIGFQNLSRLLASGKPVRVVVLDTQVYSNTGGQACTSGFTGQVSDMAAYGRAQHGKVEARKELALIAIAHRGAFVHQTSQASASHLLAGVLKGLQSRRPAVFNIYTPCPVEHGLADDWAQHAARLALESRAFPFLTYDPDGGPALADCLSLDGNPSADDRWPTYTLSYVDDGGEERTIELPLTIADWAATEGRFAKQFSEIAREAWDETQIPFHTFLELPSGEREGKTPFVHTIAADRRLRRLRVAPEIVRLAEERLQFWSELRQMAGLEVATAVRDRIASEVEAEFERRAAALQADYDAKLAELRATYPQAVARRLAEGLLRASGVGEALGGLLAELPATPVSVPVPVPARPAEPDGDGAVAAGSRAATVPAPGGPPRQESVPAASTIQHRTAAAATTAPAPAASDDLAIEAFIDSERCTSCNECTNLNARMFAYDANKQAFVKDPRAGTFQQLVLAAEHCPVGAIHPGTPLNPKEKDLEKWVRRAAPFN